MKRRFLKRIISGFCATIMVMSSFVTSVGATNTTDAEVAFSLKYLDSLPKKGEDNFDKFLKLPDIDKMNEERLAVVKHKDRPDENIPVKEKTAYQQLWNEVDKIENKVDGKITSDGTDTPNGDATNNDDNMSRQMKIAGEIYKWVAENIEYDFESIDEDENGKTPFRKPQDALFVYQQRTGVCAGKADLTALMMRMAKIPSIYIGSTVNEKGNCHAYNAIYLEENNDNRKGWTLLDSTWGSVKSDKTLRESDEKSRLNEIKNTINVEDVLFSNNFTELNVEIFNELKPANKSKLDRHDEYAKKITEICESLFKEYEPIVEKVKTDKKTLEETISEMAKKINLKISELNTQFTDIVTFKIFNIYLTDYDSFVEEHNIWAIQVKAEKQLSFAEAEEIVNRARELQKELLLKDHFPSFYDMKLDFKSANESIIKKTVHKVEYINNCCSDDYTYSKCYDGYYCEHDFKINGVKYKLDGKEGNSYIKLSGNNSKPAVDVKIPSDIANLGMTFKVGFDIESIDLEGDTIVDLSGAYDLKNVNTENSNKYTAKEAILCDKQTDEVICIFKPSGKTKNGIDYTISLDNGSGSKIWFGAFGGEEIADVKIPEFLKQFKVPITICSNITSLILESDEIVDLSCVFGLKSIDVTKSKRYEKRNDKLFDTVLNEEVKLCEGVKIIDNRSQ